MQVKGIHNNSNWLERDCDSFAGRPLLNLGNEPIQFESGAGVYNNKFGHVQTVRSGSLQTLFSKRRTKFRRPDYRVWTVQEQGDDEAQGEWCHNLQGFPSFG